jgi:hypothetical protein
MRTRDKMAKPKVKKVEIVIRTEQQLAAVFRACPEFQDPTLYEQKGLINGVWCALQDGQRATVLRLVGYVARSNQQAEAKVEAIEEPGMLCRLQCRSISISFGKTEGGVIEIGISEWREPAVAIDCLRSLNAQVNNRFVVTWVVGTAVKEGPLNKIISLLSA